MGRCTSPLDLAARPRLEHETETEVGENTIHPGKSLVMVHNKSPSHHLLPAAFMIQGELSQIRKTMDRIATAVPRLGNPPLAPSMFANTLLWLDGQPLELPRILQD